MVNYAHFTVDTAYLSSDFGERFAREKFGDAIVDALPRFKRGKRVGKLKGMVRWEKCTRGGWVREPGTSADCVIGHVENRVGKVVKVELCTADWGKEPKVLHTWAPEFRSRYPSVVTPVSPEDLAEAIRRSLPKQPEPSQA